MVPLLLLQIFWRGCRDRRHWAGWRERLGFYGRSAMVKNAIWIHAVSVGESTAAVPLIRALRERYEALDIVVTTTTLTGAENVARTLGDSVVQVYFPYDLPAILRRFLIHFSPRLLIIMETELWPNTIAQCRQREIPILLANARLSEHSLHAYLKLSAVSRELIRSFNVIAAQSAADADRFHQLGADHERIQITGSLKFDVELPASLLEEAEVLRRKLGVNRPVLIFGSTRDGEEALLLPAMAPLQTLFADLLLVIAPRHPERFGEVAALCRDAGFTVVTDSSQKACVPETAIYLLDVMGELPRFYAAADVAFVGGSLLPLGGHNVLEPAALGIPVLCGPYTHNFAEICQLLSDVGALIVVEDADAVAVAAAGWLGDSNERDRVGQIGRDIVRAHGGATRRTLEMVENYLMTG